MEVQHDDKYIWVIKDSKNRFANQYSIKNNSQYICFNFFTPECRGYITKKSAENALSKLNTQKSKFKYEETFHIEYHNLDKLINEASEFEGENINIINIDKISA